MRGEIRNQWGGFTLVEMLVVIAILLLLASITLAVYNSNRSSDRMRSAARVAQSAFMGAKDRAMHARNLRGVRLVRDLTDPSLVTGFVYLAPIENRSYGGSIAGSGTTIQILRPDANNDGQGTDATSSDATILSGTGSGIDWVTLDTNGFLPWPAARVRIPATTGHWYVLQPVAGRTSPPYYTQTRGSAVLLTLSTGFDAPDATFPNVVAVDTASGKASCELELACELLPFHQPTPLSSGIVIDLDQSSPNVQSLWPTTPVPAHIDLMFSPRGMIGGATAGLGNLHFLLNDIADATQNLNPIDPRNRGDKLILTVNPQTGLVSTYPIDPTDANQDGIADDLFRFAKQGKTAGQ
ncbi:MAG: prepilin-type N-terminal cleavage/methylation domain-containing protein [Planctomycetia bacterium]|nr:prepilin-type N-terminal cleavage/methylation domain-containing protein [Planctomycetia bacterium]